MNTEMLKLAGVAAIISTIGTLIALFLKEFLFVRYFEKRKKEQSIDEVYKKYKDPITLSTIELSLRLIQIHYLHPAKFLSEEVKLSSPTSIAANSDDDGYFK